MERVVTPEKREQILQQMQAQLVQMMGSVEGMDQHVRTWEAQAYENSRGIERDYIARMANRLQKIENKLQEQQQQQQQQQQQLQQQQHFQQQQQQFQSPQQPVLQQTYQAQPQSRFAQPSPQQNNQLQQNQYGQVVTSVPGSSQGAARMQQQSYANYAMHNAHARQQPQQQAPHMDVQHSMGPDSEIFADMAHAFILGPSDVSPQEPPQQQHFQQQSHQRQNMSYGVGNQSYSPGPPPAMQAWQQPQYSSYASPQQYQPPQHSQMQYQQTGSPMPAGYGMQQQPGAQPSSMYSAQQQRPQMQPQQQQHGVAASPKAAAAAAEAHWVLLEEMRGEFLGDLEDYARLLRTAERGPQPSEKMAKLVNIIARLSLKREENVGRQFSAKEVQGLQSLQQQLRLYVAKLRTMLEPYRKQARPHALLCAIVAPYGFGHSAYARSHAQQRRQEAEARQVQQGQGAGTPSQTQPGPPAPSAAPLQGGRQALASYTPRSMPTPPGTSPGDGKLELPVTEGAAKAAWEEGTLTPGQRLIRQLAASRPGAVAAAAGSAAAVAMREGSDIASPPLPLRLRPAGTLSDDSSHPQEPRLVRSVNVAKESEPTSPDSVLDLRAGYKRKRTEQQTQDLQLLRHKIQAECSQMIEVLRVLPPQLEAKTGASFDIQECEDVEGALIVAATVPAVAAAAADPRPGGGALSLGPGVRTLRMRVDDAYPARPPTLLFPEPAGAVSSNSAQEGAIRGAFEVAVTTKAQADPLDIKLLAEQWAATLVNTEQMVAGAVP
ncbi:hypothetical protein COCSUDRAFT_66250 [Coccomyxa subellipsoidea C-169]|uniref:Uncharacterized protein n=1 Tax=Coccomyxa subellipsoidea (strain C-169) TaxID=574566 RepID=I0YY01_COCSC|nr:hypothetical protein COCSUDRAFT_66250 [Coccomyxa subellipsoidea C-169]EIE23270.1 hypothetical protein COCSUDRAFT_66250 [Coccomyxa subellipsoidea C-169]|eukprot:XP_005647814.1 hypothetical protein COCSUDRAFT_66250 [Coccomyxa subellipsoidea C-169]